LALPEGEGEGGLQGALPVQAVAVAEVQAAPGKGVAPLEEEGVKETFGMVVAEAGP
jgi:hypothetical protein